MNMKNLGALLTCCLGGLLCTPMANAVCTSASVSGVYGFHRVGAYVNGAAGFAYPGVFGSVGHFTADGNGHITSITETFSLDGVIVQSGTQTATPPARFPGSYVVNADCTGYFDILNSIDSGVGWANFVIENNGSELHFVGTNQGATQFGAAIVEQPGGVPATCSGPGTLTGPWGSQSFGIYFDIVVAANGGTGLSIAADVALVNFDGAGNAALTEGTDSNIFSTTQGITSFRGKYTVNADCTGTVTLLGTGPGSEFANVYYVLVNNNKEMLFINIGNPSLALGTMKMQ